MSTIEHSIEIDVPVRTAYDQWTQFEEFPRFMEGVESVEQLDDARLHWRARIGGQEREWDAEIVEQVPDERIAWRSISGPPQSGVLTFQRISDDRCRVILQMEVEPETAGEKIADAAGLLDRRIELDLERFKEFIEERRIPTGSWRGEIPPE